MQNILARNLIYEASRFLEPFNLPVYAIERMQSHEIFFVFKCISCRQK